MFEFSGRGILRPLNLLGTPGMGVNLWGEGPLYMNPAPSFYDGSRKYQPKASAFG